MSNNQIVITSNDMESTYYCDWFVKADSVEKSLLFTFKNQNLEDVRANQLVIRMYDLMKDSSNVVTGQPIDESGTAVALRQGTSNEGVLDEFVENQPIYEYKLDGSIKHFQADTSYVRLQ